MTYMTLAMSKGQVKSDVCQFYQGELGIFSFTPDNTIVVVFVC